MMTSSCNSPRQQTFASVWSQFCELAGDVCLGWRTLSGNRLSDEDGERWHRPPQAQLDVECAPAVWQTLLALSQDDQWSVLQPAGSPFAHWTAIYRAAVTCDESNESAFMLVIVASDAAALNEKLIEEIPTLGGWLALQWHYAAKARQLNDLKHVVMSQSVWLECIEWLKSVGEENEKFYKEFLPRVMLLMNADFALLMWDTAEGRQFHWRGRRLSDATREILMTRMAAFDMPINNSFTLDACEEQARTQCHEVCLKQLLVTPINNPHFRYRGAILFGKNQGKDAFSMLEEMYFQQLVAQCGSVLEKNALVEELHEWHEQLLAERVKEKELMEKLQSAQAQLIQSEKLASIGQLAAGVAHEINNPVGYVSCNLSSLERYFQTLWTTVDKAGQLIVQLNPEEGAARLDALVVEEDLEFVREDLGHLIKETREGLDRVKRIVNDLKDFSRSDSGEFLPVDLRECIEKTLNIVHNELKYKADVIREFDDLPPVEMAESQFGQVIMNLLVNAAQAMESQGTIRISAKRHDDVYVRVSVADTGSGIPPEVMKKIFDPFFTTKPVGKGTGLGLSISYGIVQRHNGRFEVESEPGKGTTFNIYLPFKQSKQD